MLHVRQFYSDPLYYICEESEGGTPYDDATASSLGLSFDEYRNFLLERGGEDWSFHRRIYFRTFEQAQKVLDEFEPYCILKKLAGGSNVCSS